MKFPNLFLFPSEELILIIFLQNYINIVLMNPILASSLATKKFVDPDNYSTPFQGK